MYTTAISLLVIGTILLILNLFLFLKDFSKTILSSNLKSMLYVNGIVTLSSLGVIALSVYYIFLIYTQLN